MNKQEILNLIETAKAFKAGKAESCVAGKAVAMMFLENSTRTKCSFELAAKRLGLHVLDFEASKSSFSKGETLVDTLHNLYFIGIEAVVIRSSENGLLEKTQAELKYPIKLVNAGEGNLSHPTQALLDFMTMTNERDKSEHKCSDLRASASKGESPWTEKMDSIEGKKIVIVGDIKHSRVAKSNVELLSKFGADIHLCAPSCFRDDTPAIWHDNLEEAIRGADVVMMLRMQRERHEGQDYSFNNFGLTSKKLEKYAPNAILMHPGPVNRDVEISSELLDSPKGITILEQAQNGTFVRMAVLQEALSGGK